MSDVDFLLSPEHMQGQVPSRGHAAQPAAEQAPTRRARMPQHSTCAYLAGLHSLHWARSLPFPLNDQVP